MTLKVFRLKAISTVCLRLCLVVGRTLDRQLVLLGLSFGFVGSGVRLFAVWINRVREQVINLLLVIHGLHLTFLSLSFRDDGNRLRLLSTVHLELRRSVVLVDRSGSVRSLLHLNIVASSALVVANNLVLLLLVYSRPRV